MWMRILKISGKVIGGIIVMMLLTSALLLIFKDDIKGYALEEAKLRCELGATPEKPDQANEFIIKIE